MVRGAPACSGFRDLDLAPKYIQIRLWIATMGANTDTRTCMRINPT